MILQILIAIMVLNTISASNVLVLHHENDQLLARKANAAEHESSSSWSMWSIMSSAYHMVVDHKPTPEEILQDLLKNVVFPDGRNAAGELISDYKLPSVTEMTVNQREALSVIHRLDSNFRNNEPQVYCATLRVIIDYASKGNMHALSKLAWLYSAGNHIVYRISWPYIDQERAALFREVANESLTGIQTQEEVLRVLQALVTKSRLLNQQENKKES